MPEPVDQSLRDKIDTVPHLDALLLLWSSRPKTRSAEHMTKVLFLAPGPRKRSWRIFECNEFMFALKESAKTITVGVATLSGAFTDEIPWGLLAAGAVAS